MSDTAPNLELLAYLQRNCFIPTSVRIEDISRVAITASEVTATSLSYARDGKLTQFTHRRPIALADKLRKALP